MDEQSTDEQQQPVDEQPVDEQQPADQETPAEDDVSRETEDDEPADKSDVGKLRREAASWRTKYRAAESEVDTLRREVFHARVKETGRLADASDMEFDAELLDDKDALNTAIDELLNAKPHLKARSFGNVGQSDRPATPGVSLGDILRNGA